MKNELNSALMAKNHYITPDTRCQTIRPVGSVCELSVFGTETFHYGGGSDGTNPEQKPF